MNLFCFFVFFPKVKKQQRQEKQQNRISSASYIHVKVTQRIVFIIISVLCNIHITLKYAQLIRLIKNLLTKFEILINFHKPTPWGSSVLMKIAETDIKV